MRCQFVVDQGDRGVALERQGQFARRMPPRFELATNPGNLLVSRSFRPDFDWHTVRPHDSESWVGLPRQAEANALTVGGDERQRLNFSFTRPAAAQYSIRAREFT